jgi:tetratricopeptide (TPR) repeat protein
VPSRKSLAREHVKRGLKELERGRPAAAQPLLRQAVELDPGDPRARAYLGTALLQLGDTAAAIQQLEHARREAAAEAWMIGNLAEAYFRAGRHEAAEDAFRAASRLDPGNPNFQLGIANCLALQGRCDDAAQLVETMLRHSPNHPLLWFTLGNVRRDQGRLEDAARCFGFALDAAPDWVEARNSLGSVQHALFRFDQAEQAYRSCIAAQPERTDFRVNLASLLLDRGQAAEAEAVCRALVAQAPGLPMAHGFLGAALSHQGKLLEALEHEQAAARLDPSDAQAAENHAGTLAQLGRWDAAWWEFERALRLQQAEAASIRYARALALLACGRLADGWHDYAHRPASLGFEAKFPGRERCLRLPAPDALRNGAAVTLAAEQGLGDELFFLRFGRAIAQAGGRVRYLASAKLHALLRCAEPFLEVVQEQDLDPDAALMPVGDLPAALRSAGLPDGPAADGSDVSAADYPGPLRLQASAGRIAAVRERLRASGPPPYVALTWNGGVPPLQQRREWTLYKAIAAAELGRALIDLPGTLISVQRQPRAEDMQALSAASGRPLHDYADLNDALADMLALLELVDEYVGVSNTNMHIRAGAGKPARVLVPAPAEWRWAGADARSPWFPDFVCYRQSLDGDWSAALARLERDLRAALDG